MIKILKYSFFDLVRSKWIYAYFLFYLLLGFVLLFLNNNLSKSIITLMNIIMTLTPLIATIFGVIYYYDSREFIELLLSQPIKRKTIFIGQYLGLTIALSSCLLLGLGIPFIFYGIFTSLDIWSFVFLLGIGVLFNFIFVSISYIIGLLNENKVKGFGYSILIWLFFSVIYDGIFLILLVQFEEYPLDKFSIIMTLLNPVDLGRILILLKLDISALMGYTGAMFNNFLGNNLGILSSLGALLIWLIIPILQLLKISNKKDF